MLLVRVEVNEDDWIGSNVVVSGDKIKRSAWGNWYKTADNGR